jgi:hypothetical protein
MLRPIDDWQSLDALLPALSDSFLDPLPDNPDTAVLGPLDVTRLDDVLRDDSALDDPLGSIDGAVRRSDLSRAGKKSG